MAKEQHTVGKHRINEARYYAKRIAPNAFTVYWKGVFHDIEAGRFLLSVENQDGLTEEQAEQLALKGWLDYRREALEKETHREMMVLLSTT